MKKAQSTLEYAIITAIVIAALLSMNVYIKRGLQGGYRQQADNFGSQYAPKETTSDIINRIYGEGNTSTSTVEATVDGKDKLITTTDFDGFDGQESSSKEELGPFK